MGAELLVAGAGAVWLVASVNIVERVVPTWAMKGDVPLAVFPVVGLFFLVR